MKIKFLKKDQPNSFINRKKEQNVFFILLLLLIVVIYFFLRLYQLEKLLNFRLDQSVHLLEVRKMFETRKIRLIGPMVTSKSFEGRHFFIGANYYYILCLIALLARWSPLIITQIFIFLEAFFYIIFTLFLKKKFGPFWSLIVLLFISISPYLINHSRFFWNPHLLIPFSILVIFFLDKFTDKKIISASKKYIYLFLASFFWGMGFSCHYTAFIWIILFVFTLYKSRRFFNLKSLFFIFLGFILGDLPFFIFEVRHNFYNLKTIYYVFTHLPPNIGLTSHYFIFPMLTIFIFAFLNFLSFSLKNQKIGTTFLVIVLSCFYFFQILLISKEHPLDIVPGWNFPEQEKVAEIILKDGCPSNFNVAATIQGDTRFYDLRYLLEINECRPLPVDQYPKSKLLFLIAPPNRLPQEEKVWEISSFRPFKVDQKILINENVIFYKLKKLEE